MQLLRQSRFWFCTAPPSGSAPFQQKKAIFTTSERSESYEHIYDPILDLTAKSFRKAYLDRQVIDFKKVIVPAKRFRAIDDTLAVLQKKHEVAAVIEAREEHMDIDLIFDHYQLASVKRRICANAAPIYVRLPESDREIRCTLGDILKDIRSDWPWKINLRRYIVGRPNLLWIPVSVETNYDNESTNRGTSIDQAIHGVWVYSYNNTYPTRFVINPKNITTSRPYKLGDLQNTFPDGVVLHERYKKMIHRVVATIEQDEEEKFFKQAEYQQMKKVDTVEIMRTDVDDEEETVEGEMLYKKQVKVADKKPKKKRERSLKKLVKQANQELIKEVQAKEQAKK